jgi:hypothetical protein
MRFFFLGAVGLSLNLVACGTGGNGGKTTSAGGSNPGTGGTSTTKTTTTMSTGPGMGGGASFAVASSSGGMADAGHVQQCDDAGNCTCIRIASIGHEGVWGPCSSDSTTALQTWLNMQSTAKVDNYDTTKPMLTKEFLAPYDVIILQWMVETGMQNNDGAAWVFSDAEVTALQNWVMAGGGIIALNGYQCNGSGCPIVDVTATNQLLKFADIQFNSDDVLDPMKVTCPDCYCWGGSMPVGAAVMGAVSPGVGTWDQTSPIGIHVTDLGAYIARSIASTTATVDATDGTHVYAAHKQVGKGNVVAYGDEWVTYSGEWLGTAKCLNPSMFTNMYDPCYQKSAAQVFQIPQFWYNAIKYAASSVACFTISNPGIITTK